MDIDNDKIPESNEQTQPIEETDNINKTSTEEPARHSHLTLRLKKKRKKAQSLLGRSWGALALSAVSGAAGGYLGAKYVTPSQNGGGTVIYQSVIRNVSTVSEADSPLTYSQVSELVADSVVEIARGNAFTKQLHAPIVRPHGSRQRSSDFGGRGYYSYQQPRDRKRHKNNSNSA